MFTPTNPICLLAFALLIPTVYCAIWKREELRSVGLLAISGALTVVFYPLVNYLSTAIAFPGLGYSLGKLALFVLLPAGTIYYIERWDWRKILKQVGVRAEGMEQSLLLGLGAGVVTIAVTLAVSTGTTFDLVWRTVMFFESFTEEFYFRGVLLLYLAQKTNRKVAYATSILGFVLIHPQHFSNAFLLSTISQAILLTLVADRTKNLFGPWLGHGLNRFVPSFVRAVF